MRGNHESLPHYRHSRGSIPACAGEPPPNGSGRRRRKVYPRVCGEPPMGCLILSKRKVYPRVCGGTGCRVSTLPGVIGLSPRVRGNLRVVPAGPADLGSIPACAGEPLKTHIFSSYVGVYPRVCGGTLTCPILPGARMGLSPRVRGTSTAAASRSTTCGLSPRVRGNPWQRLIWTAQRGSIPACAGEPRRTRWQKR